MTPEGKFRASAERGNLWHIAVAAALFAWGGLVVVCAVKGVLWACEHWI